MWQARRRRINQATIRLWAGKRHGYLGLWGCPHTQGSHLTLDKQIEDRQSVGALASPWQAAKGWWLRR